MNNILLVCMPFGNVFAPSLGISLLRDGLRQRGYPCDIRYLQMIFARQIGVDLYNQIIDSFPSLLIGEWLFAEQLFPGQLPNEQDFIETIIRQYTLAHGREFSEEFIQQLAGVRAQAGEYLDLCMRTVDWDQYTIIGFTSTFAQHIASLALAQRIKEKYPQKTIIFGGANCEDEMGLETHRQFPFVDFVCSGEGDVLLPTLVERLVSGAPIDDIDGLIYRSSGQSIFNDRYAAPITDMDSLPLANFDDYFAQLDEDLPGIETTSLRLMMESSRGCWWGAKSHCTFCGLNGNTMSYRSKKPERVLEEFAYLAHRYPGIKQFTLVDNILDVRYFRDVIPGLIDMDLGISIWYEVKANLRKEYLQMLKKAGVDAIQPGIESLDSDILRLMRKGCTTIQNVQTLKWGRQYGLYIGWNLIAGFPREDPAAYQKMADLIPSLVHLQPPSSRGVSRLRLDRFSPYFHDPNRYGIINVRAVPAYQYVYPFAREVLSRMAYYFDFDYENGSDPQSYAKVLNETIEKWHDHASDGSLQILRSNGRITLFDTRVVGRVPELVLEGTAKTIYEFCDEGQNLPTILQYLAETTHPESQPVSESEVQAILDQLVQARVMIHADDRYLSLAIPMEEDALKFIDAFSEAILVGSSLPVNAPTTHTIQVDSLPADSLRERVQ